jgi:hypothetical protein
MSVKRRLTSAERRVDGGPGFVVVVIDRFGDLDHIEDEAEREREMRRRVDAARAKARGEHGEGVTVILIDVEDAEL